MDRSKKTASRVAAVVAPALFAFGSSCSAPTVRAGDPAAAAPASRYAGLPKTETFELANVWGVVAPASVAGWRQLAFSADGSRLVVASPGLLVEDAASGKVIREAGDGRAYACAALSPDGKRLLAGAEDPSSQTPLLLENLETGERSTFGAREGGCAGYAVAFSADGQHALSATSDGAITCWDLASRTAGLTIDAHLSRALSVSFVPGANQAVSMSEEGLGRWDLATGKQLVRIDTSLVAGAVSEDGLWAVTAALTFHQSPAVATLWDLTTGKQVRRLDEGDRDILRLAFSPDGKWILEGSNTSLVRVYEVATGRVVRTIRVDRSPSALAFMPRSGPNALVLAAEPRLFDASSGAELPYAPGSDVTSVAVGRDGATVVAGTRDGLIRTWSSADALPGTIKLEHAVADLAVDPEGKRLLYADAGGSVGELRGGVAEKRFSERASPHVAFVGGSQALTCNQDDATATLWDLETGAAVRTMTGTKVCPPAAEADPAYHGTGASGLAVSPDGTRALVAFRHGSASLFDLQIGKELAEIDARYVASMSFLGGVQRAVTFGESISCWAVPVGKILWRVDLEHPLATNAALSPDGHHALVGTIDGRIELWTISKTNADLADFVDLARCGDRPTATAFAPDGGSFVVGTARGAILRFRLTEHR